MFGLNYICINKKEKLKRSTKMINVFDVFSRYLCFQCWIKDCFEELKRKLIYNTNFYIPKVTETAQSSVIKYLLNTIQ